MTRVNVTSLQQAELKIILLTRCGQVVPGLKQYILAHVGRSCRGALLMYIGLAQTPIFPYLVRIVCARIHGTLAC